MKTFKKFIVLMTFPVVLIGMSTLTSSCSKDDTKEVSYTCTTCKTTSDALAANDAAIQGVYKGIVVGSTGTLSINIQNGSSTITGTMVIDGVSIALTSTVAVANGQTYVSPFTGTFNGSPVSITLSVGAGGTTPTVTTSNIPGHPNAVFTLYKETSTSLIEAFEGTVTSGVKTATFNIVLSRALSKWGYVLEKSGSPSETGSGTIKDGKELIQDTKVIGVITGDELNGSFIGGDGNTVTIKGKRTL